MENLLKKAIVYIDGFNLYYGMMGKGWGNYRWLNLWGLAEAVVPNGYRVELVRYFTSHIKGDLDKHNRQNTYLCALETQIGKKIKIHYGSYQLFKSQCNNCKAKPLYCKQCGCEYKKPNEKKTDVNIATSMLVDCFDGRTDAIILISGDSDYTAPLDEIGRHFQNILRIIAFPPQRKNGKLYNHCDEYYSIEKIHFENAGLLSDPVINRITGSQYHKPIDWI